MLSLALLFVILFLILISILSSTTTVLFGQQASMVWDEKTKSWVSTPTTATSPPTPPATPPPTTVIQPAAAAAATTSSTATVDLQTLAGVVTPIIAGIITAFIKNRKDMEKKNEEVKTETIKAIESALLPKIKQIVPIADATAKQDVKISQLAEELYKIMADKANEIHDKPEIQQLKLAEDVAKSQLIAQQTKEPTMVWDEKSKSWISK